MTATIASTTDVLSRLDRYAQHSSAFLAMNQGTQHFVSAQPEGLVAYAQRDRRHVVLLSELYAAPEDRPGLLNAFESWARDEGSRVCAVQLMEDDARLFAERDYRVNQIGVSYSINLDGYDLRGKRYVKTRNMISRARREGATASELGEESGEQLDQIDARWLRQKGAMVKEYRHLIGERGGPGSGLRRVFAAHVGDRTVAYVTFSPVFGRHAGWLYDLTRRTDNAPPGVIELVMWSAIETFRDEGSLWLHLGFTPCTGLAEGRDLGTKSGTVERVVAAIPDRAPWVYPVRSQEHFKRKWRPHLITPEYVAFDRVTPGAVWNLLRTTQAI